MLKEVWAFSIRVHLARAESRLAPAYTTIHFPAYTTFFALQQAWLAKIGEAFCRLSFPPF
jgi:hypothetical protein